MRNQMTAKVLEIIRTYAYNNDISLSEFGRRAGVSKAWISRLQNTDANLSVDTASRLLNTAGYELTITKMHSKKNEAEVISRLKKVVECQKD